MTTRFYLARHGEVDAAWRTRLYGRLDVPLSARGGEQSRRIAAALDGIRLDAVVSSGLARAEASAALVRATRPELARRDELELLELDRGPWAGRCKHELSREEPVAFERLTRSRGACGPDGSEAVESLAERVVGTLERLAREHPGGTVAVIAHLWVLRAAVAHALGLPILECGRISVPPGGFAVLDWPVGGRRGPDLVALGPERL